MKVQYRPRRAARSFRPITNHVLSDTQAAALMRIKRDEILEHDPVYRVNLKGLSARAASGKVPAWEVRNLTKTLQLRAMARAGLDYRESVNLLRA